MYTLTGQEAKDYHVFLQSCLGALATTLRQGLPDHLATTINKFGMKHQWELDRMDSHDNIYRALADQVDEVSKHYNLLRFNDDDPVIKNRFGFYDDVELGRNSNMPSHYRNINLEQRKQRADEESRSLTPYGTLVDQLQTMCKEDFASSKRVADVSSLHNDALKLAFYDKLKKTDIIPIERGKAAINAQKLVSLPAEDLWRLSYTTFSPVTGLYQTHCIDTWQSEQVHIDGEGQIDDRLRQHLTSMMHSPAAWYLIQKMDDEFPALHPVHASRGIIGPIDNASRTGTDQIPVLPIVRQNPDMRVFRFVRSYSYAPNTIEEGNLVRQEIYRDEWSDEIAICSTQDAPKVSASLKNAHVRVIEV